MAARCLSSTNIKKGGRAAVEDGATGTCELLRGLFSYSAMPSSASFQRFALECIPGRFASAFRRGMAEIRINPVFRPYPSIPSGQIAVFNRFPQPTFETIVIALGSSQRRSELLCLCHGRRVFHQCSRLGRREWKKAGVELVSHHIRRNFPLSFQKVPGCSRCRPRRSPAARRLFPASGVRMSPDSPNLIKENIRSTNILIWAE